MAALDAGMNVPEMRRLQSALMHRAGDLSGIKLRVDGAVQELRRIWQGSDSESFARQWQSDHARVLHAISKELVDFAKIAHRNIEDQVRVSQEGVSEFVDGHTFRGGEPRQGVGGRALDDLGLASATYSPGDGDAIPDGWRKADSSDLAVMGISNDDLHDPKTGFDADVYISKDGRITVAFRGTEGLEGSVRGQQGVITGMFIGDQPDIQTDVAGRNGVTEQDLQAASLALKMQHGPAGQSGQLSFTGHSLGGRLADVASMVTGLSANSFNPMGMPSSASSYFAGIRSNNSDCGSGNATAYVMVDDIAAIQNDFYGNPSANSYVQNVYIDDPATTNSFEDMIYSAKGHALDSLDRGMRNLYPDPS